MGDTSSGSLWTDHVVLPGSDSNINLTFGVQERQTGKLSAMGVQGLLALDRGRQSLIGQLRAQNESELVAFGTWWVRPAAWLGRPARPVCIARACCLLCRLRAWPLPLPGHRRALRLPPHTPWAQLGD